MDWKLSGKSRGRLREQLQTTVDARECRRCGALLRLDEGHAVSAVAREFGVSRQTLHNWRDKLQAAPEEGLRDRKRPGRPTVWNEERVRMLKQLLAESPRQHGFYAVGWTAGLLQARLEQLLEWDVSQDSLRRKLHQIDYVWKRYRYRLKPDPLREKKRRIRNHVNDLPRGAAVLFQDETDLMLFPPLRSGWTKKGQPADVEICGGNAKRVVFGTVSLMGHRLLMVRRKQRSIDFPEFLKLVDDHYRQRSVLIILDGDISHTASASKQLARKMQIALEWLPVRSPELKAMLRFVSKQALRTVGQSHRSETRDAAGTAKLVDQKPTSAVVIDKRPWRQSTGVELVSFRFDE